jgi:hypothetical protein
VLGEEFDMILRRYQVKFGCILRFEEGRRVLDHGLVRHGVLDIGRL